MIELNNLQKVIDQSTVIDIPSLKIGTGEIVALTGTVDSGKEILLKLLTGQIRPTLGSIYLADIDPFQQKDRFSRKVGVLFSEDGMYAHRSAKANLEFHCSLYGLPHKQVEEVLTRVGLMDHADVKFEKLSSSLARRLAFGRAILHNPEVLLLAEPFARCDDSSTTLLSGLLRELSTDGVTVLILSEENLTLNTLCDTIHHLEQGRITETYHPKEERRSEMPFKIPVRLENKVALINPADILFAYAESGSTFLQTINARLPTQFTLSELEERLARSGFFRAHRGFLVNLQHVKEVIPYTRNSFSMRLDDANSTEIPLSKSAAAELRDLLGY
jgi:ABC-2 type transport system ATP-binding protein